MIWRSLSLTPTDRSVSQAGLPEALLAGVEDAVEGVGVAGTACARKGAAWARGQARGGSALCLNY